MNDQIKNQIITLAGSKNWEEGSRMQGDNAVLDTHRDGKIIEARVANNAGRFERVRVQFKGSSVVVRCTCNKRSSGYCQHTVAAILQLGQDDPELLESVFSQKRKPTVDIPLPPIESELPPSVTEPVAPARDLSWKAFIERSQTDARIDILINGPPPCLESRWKRIEMNVSIIFNKRSYSAGNMKQLIEVGAAAGGMKIDDFSIQEQQLMRFLVGSAELVGNRYILNSYEMADLMHCMSGCENIKSASGRINIHIDPLQLVLLVDQQSTAATVTPRFYLAEQGLLPSREANPVVGRGGSWIGFGSDYWWLSGIADSAWLRTLVNNKGSLFSSEELQCLAESCKLRRIPARLMANTEEREIKAEPGICRPVLTLDWEDKAISATLEFDYGDHRIPIDGPDILWQGDRFVSRDSMREQQAMNTLEKMGFSTAAHEKGIFRLRDPGKLLPFLKIEFDNLDEDWIVYYSTRFNRKRNTSGDIRMRTTSRREGESWFEIDCELTTADGQQIPLEQALRAIQDQRDYIRLQSGAIARISQELQHALNFYLERHEKQTGSGFRFGRFAALPVLLASGSFLRSRNAKWQKLCRRLMDPVKINQLDIPSPSLASQLRDYQKEGAAWIATLEECGFNGILADEMGLGKTIQALTVLLRRRNNNNPVKTSLIVCPTSLVENWRMEAEKFTPELNTAIISGSERKNLLENLKTLETDIAITSYALLRRDIDDYSKIEFDYVILDEAQHIKNPETANARTCKTLSAEHKLILTGTPVENSIHEVWSLFDFLMPGILGNRQYFREKYELSATDNGISSKAGSPTELASQIHPFILRRTKKEVCKQLPPKLEHVVYCEFHESQRKIYNQLVTTGSRLLRKARTDGWNKNRMELLSILLRLRQICCHPQLLPENLIKELGAENMVSAKTELLQEIILEAIDGDHRMLIFSQFTKMLRIITEWLNERGIPYEYLDGSTKNRQARVNRFNNDSSIPVFIISLKAGGTGLNLTGADTVIHYDPWWNPMVEDQATDRTHRIGQANLVTSFKLVARHTIEEKILCLQAGKRELFDQLIGGAPGKAGQLNPEDFEFLLQR